MSKLNITERTKANRLPKRVSYDPEVINIILDSTFICHLGFKIDDRVFIIPTAFGRDENNIYIHCSKNSRIPGAVYSEEDLCLSFTILDAIVLARSAFHHSINYRSVILFSKGKEIKQKTEKIDALKIIFDHIIPGRWEDVRKPNEKELNATAVFQFKIEEASAKIRTGPAVDDKEDINLNIWAGIIPFEFNAKAPVKNDNLPENILLPDYIKLYKSKK